MNAELVEWDIASIANVIQISVAPVFLLAGIAGLLAVLTSRLGRALDRSRSLQATETDFLPEKQRLGLETEMLSLIRRGRLIHIAISLATTSALLVCFVIILLFTGTLAKANLSVFIASLFIVALSVLSLAFLSFLLEIFISIRTLKLNVVSAESFRRFEQNREQQGNDKP
ncbi:MAG: hypothetical protein ACI845_003716 [Gammaproteobacteria bacterium]|jgi:hypothetical protein